LLLVGGGARSPAYRQRCADLHQAPVRVPEVDEAVATGAAVQAAALVTATTHQEIAAEWELDAGLVVEPDAPEQGARLRARFADALAAAGA
jgi:xylulokinase